MSEASEGIARWLEQKRRTDRAWAATICAIALGGAAAVFLLMALGLYTVLSIVCGSFVHPGPWLGLVAAVLTAGFFARSAKSRHNEPDTGMDPMGFWMIKDIFSIGPRLMLEGMRQIRCCAQLGELNVGVCARALAYLAGQNAAVNWDDLKRYCPQLPQERLREQLLLLDGVLFLGEDASRVTLMDPFRLRLRWMLGREHSAGRRQEPTRPTPERPLQPAPVNDPEKLGVYEILGLTPSASIVEIKTAYRKRVKACHPDLFEGMDQQAKALAERWTKALNVAYARLNPRAPGARPSPTRHIL